MCARTRCPLSSRTRNIVLGRHSSTVPWTSMTPALSAMGPEAIGRPALALRARSELDGHPYVPEDELDLRVREPAIEVEFAIFGDQRSLAEVLDVPACEPGRPDVDEEAGGLAVFA